jgi:membrane associated rhomboid family serine protease
LGASGAIAGVLGAYVVLFPRTRVHTLVMLGWFWDTVEIPAVYVLGVWFLLQLIPGMSMQVGGGVAYWAHIGGFVIGAMIILLLGKNRLLRNRRPLRRPWNDDKPYPFRPWS